MRAGTPPSLFSPVVQNNLGLSSSGDVDIREGERAMTGGEDMRHNRRADEEMALPGDNKKWRTPELIKHGAAGYSSLAKTTTVAVLLWLSPPPLPTRLVPLEQVRTQGKPSFKSASRSLLHRLWAAVFGGEGHCQWRRLSSEAALASRSQQQPWCGGEKSFCPPVLASRQVGPLAQRQQCCSVAVVLGPSWRRESGCVSALVGVSPSSRPAVEEVC
ncbi:unnamed protein product [Pleuronectes platessa]|uniref:Uncharacterized protein n=1 Tax=Pleuronectes platessa TaxID=8262 RepID=A0A9N7YB71_PLEPL|nr:unnamed protein product [Pleuronectes platessa]